jgi:putative membrane protein
VECSTGTTVCNGKRQFLVITDKLTDHLKIDSFGWALGGALVMSLVGTVGEWMVRSVF